MQYTFPVLDPSDIAIEAGQLGFACTASQISSCEPAIIHRLLYLLACKVFDRSVDTPAPTVDQSLSCMVLPLQTYKMMSKCSQVGIRPVMSILYNPARDPQHIVELISGYLNFVKYRMATIEQEAQELKANHENLLKIEEALKSEKSAAFEERRRYQDEWVVRKPLYDQKEQAVSKIIDESKQLKNELTNLNTQEEQLINELNHLTSSHQSRTSILAEEKKLKVDVSQLDDINRKIKTNQASIKSTSDEINENIHKTESLKLSITAFNDASIQLDRLLQAQEEAHGIKVKGVKTGQTAKDLERKKSEWEKELSKQQSTLQSISNDCETASLKLEEVAGAKLALLAHASKLRTRLESQLAIASNAEAAVAHASNRGNEEIEKARNETARLEAEILNFQVDLENSKTSHNRIITSAKHKIAAIAKKATEVLTNLPTSPDAKRTRC